MSDPVIEDMQIILKKYSGWGWKYHDNGIDPFIETPKGFAYDARALRFGDCPICSEDGEDYICHGLHEEETEREIEVAKQFLGIVDAYNIYRMFGFVYPDKS